MNWVSFKNTPYMTTLTLKRLIKRPKMVKTELESANKSLIRTTITHLVSFFQNVVQKGQ